MRKKKVTLQDIADLCQTSKSTVSRVVTKRGYVAPDLRDYILDTIEKEGYRQQKSHKENNVQDMVMVISCQLNSNAQMILADSIRRRLEEKQIRTAIISVDFGSSNVYDYLDYARERNFGGVITLGILDTNEFRTSLKKLHCPVVLLNQSVEGMNSGIVYINDYQSAYEATQYLLRRGHEKIAFLSGYRNASAIKDRENGFVQCMKDHGFLADDLHIIYKSFEQSSGRAFANEMQQQGYPYTAVLTVAEELTQGLYLQLKENNVRIPEDISILGFGTSDALTYSSPSVTSMQYDFAQIGVSLADKLAQHMASPYMRAKVEYFDAKLVEGESVSDRNKKNESK